VSALSQEDISDRDSLMEEVHGLEEPQVMGDHEECPDSQVIAKGYDTEVIDAQELQEPPHLESPLMNLDETVEHALTDSGDSLDGDTSMWDL
jgi:hypothetical protein